MGRGRGEGGGRYASGLGKKGVTDTKGARLTNVARAARQSFEEIKVR